MRKGLAALVTCLVVFAITSAPGYAAAGDWTLRSIDNMHLTRDYPCWPESDSFMASIAASERTMGATLASVTTPYDPPNNYHQCTPSNPVAFEQSWVNALRAHGLQVWFRQTWFNWEGSYGAPKLDSATTPAISPGSATNVLNGTDTTSYMAKTYHFILSNPSLFRNGDIFTPEPEPQNGGILVSYGVCGSSLCQFHDWPALNQWLRDSMTVDTVAFQQLGLQVRVGFWGLPCSNDDLNGNNDIDASTIAQMGNYVTDCYFRDVATEVSHLQQMNSLYNTPVIVGEWGDIWDGGVQPTSANEVSLVMSAAAGLSFVQGFNYWQIYGGGGGENLVDPDTLQINQSGSAVQSIFTSASGPVPITGYGGLCTDDRSASTANFNPIQIYTCNGTAAQQWTVMRNDNTLRVLGKCMDVFLGGMSDGTKVDLYDCNGSGAQMWIPQSNGSLYNPQSDKCLDDTNWSTTPGTQLQIWDCTGLASQIWHMS